MRREASGSGVAADRGRRRLGPLQALPLSYPLTPVSLTAPLHQRHRKPPTSLTEGTIMLTSEVLDKAADLIERDGWYPGQMSRTAPACAANAIYRVCHRPDERHPNVGAMVDAFHRFAEYVGGRESPDIWRWNDTPGRTAGEVIAALRAASVVQAARENQLVAVS